MTGHGHSHRRSGFVQQQAALAWGEIRAMAAQREACLPTRRIRAQAPAIPRPTTRPKRASQSPNAGPPRDLMSRDADQPAPAARSPAPMAEDGPLRMLAKPSTALTSAMGWSPGAASRGASTRARAFSAEDSLTTWPSAKSYARHDGQRLSPVGKTRILQTGHVVTPVLTGAARLVA